MDIYSILSSKSHNVKYLKEYYDFITICTDTSATIKHHICPKASDLFPEYIDFNVEFSWNKILLSFEQHVEAHRLLALAYGKSQAFAYKMMISKCPSDIKMVSAKSILDGSSICITKSEFDQYKNIKYVGIKYGIKESEISKTKKSIASKDIKKSKSHCDNISKARKDMINVICNITNIPILISVDVYNNDKSAYTHYRSNSVASDRCKEATSKANSGIVNAFDLELNIFVRITQSEFDQYKNIKYVGRTHRIAKEFKDLSSK